MITPASTSPAAMAAGIRSNLTSTGIAEGHSIRSSSAAVVSGPGIATRRPRKESSVRGARATTTGP